MKSALSAEADVFVPKPGPSATPGAGRKLRRIPRYMISCYPFVTPDSNADGLFDPQLQQHAEGGLLDKLGGSLHPPSSLPLANDIHINSPAPINVDPCSPCLPQPFPAFVPSLVNTTSAWFDPTQPFVNGFHSPQNGLLLPAFLPPTVAPPTPWAKGHYTSLNARKRNEPFFRPQNAAIHQTRPPHLCNGFKKPISHKTWDRFTQTDFPADMKNLTLQQRPSPLHVQATNDDVPRQFSVSMHQLSLQQHCDSLPANSASCGTDSMCGARPPLKSPPNRNVALGDLTPSDVLASLPVAEGDEIRDIYSGDASSNAIGSILLRSRSLSGGSANNSVSMTGREAPSNVANPGIVTSDANPEFSQQQAVGKILPASKSRGANKGKLKTTSNVRSKSDDRAMETDQQNPKNVLDSDICNKTAIETSHSVNNSVVPCVATGIYDDSPALCIENDFPDLSSCHDKQSLACINSVHATGSSYSDALKGGFRNSFTEEFPLDLNSDSKVSRKWQRRWEKANRAAEHELAEISLEQRMLQEIKYKTQPPMAMETAESAPIKITVTSSQSISNPQSNLAKTWPALPSHPITSTVTPTVWSMPQSRPTTTCVTSSPWSVSDSKQNSVAVTTQAWSTNTQVTARPIVSRHHASPEPMKSPGTSRSDRNDRTSKGLIPMKVVKNPSQKSTPKSQQPITLDFAGMLDIVQNKKSEENITPPNPNPKQEKTHAVSHNPLDSSCPTQKRGKERESPKPKKPSPLKKVILKEREEKKRMRDEIEDTAGQELPKAAVGVGVIPESDLSQDAAPGAKYDGASPGNTDLSPISQTSPISFSPLSSGVNSPIGSAYARGMMNVMSMKIHSRRFREYCKQILDKEIDTSCTKLLQDLVRFQDRTFSKDPIKAKSKRRIVLGLREVTKHLKLRKIKCVIISPNLEKIQSKGGLDDALNKVIELCSDQEIPFVFALGRRALGWACGKMVPVSVVGVFNYGGSDENFKHLMSLTSKAQEAYTEMMALLEKEASEMPQKSGVYAHMGHSRTPSACSAISFSSSILSEPISENYPQSEPETDSRGNVIDKVKEPETVGDSKNAVVDGICGSTAVGNGGCGVNDDVRVADESIAKTSSERDGKILGDAPELNVRQTSMKADRLTDGSLRRKSDGSVKLNQGNACDGGRSGLTSDSLGDVWKTRGVTSNRSSKSQKNVCFVDCKPQKKSRRHPSGQRASFCDDDDDGGNVADVEDLDENENVEKRKDVARSGGGLNCDDVLLELPRADQSHGHDVSIEIMSQHSSKTADTNEGTVSTTTRTVQESSLGGVSVAATIGSASCYDENLPESHRCVKRLDKERIDLWVTQSMETQGHIADASDNTSDNCGDTQGDTDSGAPLDSDGNFS